MNKDKPMIHNSIKCLTKDEMKLARIFLRQARKDGLIKNLSKRADRKGFIFQSCKEWNIFQRETLQPMIGAISGKGYKVKYSF